jgi:hypothetical protein
MASSIMPPTVTQMIASAVRREPLTDPVSAGYSGARLERLELPDGSTVILKSSSPSIDLAMAATSDPGRAFIFAVDGTYDRLPPSIDSTVLATDRDGDMWRMVMADVAEHLLPEGQPITRDQSSRILSAVRDLHSSYAASDMALLCPLESHLALFSPANMRPFVDGPNPLPRLAIDAWERFDTSTPARMRTAVHAIHADPDHLAADLTSRDRTLTHADLALANIGFTDEHVIMLDFALACSAPGDFDFAIFLIQNDWLIDASNDDLVDDWVSLSDGQTDERRLRLSLLAAFAEYGCWKAPDENDPSPYCDTFDWWLDAAQRAVDTDGGHFGW